MSKKAVAALMIALALPLLGFLLLSYFGNRNIQMPNHYFYDSVIVNNDRGKTTYDTLWHRVGDLQLTNQLGQNVSMKDLGGKVIVLDYFFTHCPTICPLMTVSMKKLQSALISDSLVQFVSISVDPENDDVSRLQWWAERFNISPDNWWLATGDKRSIYDYALSETKASVADVGIDTGFIHTENFFLIDRKGVIRGWYNGLNEDDMKRIARDIPLLILEKGDKTSFWGDIRKEYNIPTD